MDQPNNPILADVGDADDPASIATAIQNLEPTLAALPFSSEVLSHYRHIPAAIQAVYNTLLPAAQLISSTATKYALLARSSGDAPPLEYASDLLRGSRLLVAACWTLQNPDAGCSISVQRHTRQAVRAILRAVGTFLRDPSAPHTGVVWEACHVIDKVPRGNRNAMRRDLLIYVSECQETIREFQTLVDDSPGEQEGDEDHYSARELPVAEACLGLLKCSRGLLKATMEMMDHLDSGTGTTTGDTAATNDTSDADRWRTLATIHERACTVGYGVTTFGAALYPPLWPGGADVVNPEVRDEVERQVLALRQLLQYVVEEVHPRYDFPDAILNVVVKIQSAVEVRTAEALQGITAYEE
jgi:Grap2 and cyclin-D-interacting